MTLELEKVPMASSESSPLNDQRHERDVVLLVPKERPAAEDGRREGPANSFVPAGQMSERDTAPQPAPVTQTAPAAAAASPELVQQIETKARNLAVCVGMAREGSNFSARLPAVEPFIVLRREEPTAEKIRRDPDGLRVSPTNSHPDVDVVAKQTGSTPVGPVSVQDAAAQPIPVTQSAPDVARQPRFKNDQFASGRPSIGRRTFRTLARFFIAALIGVGATLGWQYHGDEAKEIVRTWAPSLDWLSSSSTAMRMADAIQPISDEAKEMVWTLAASLGWLSSVSTTKSPPRVDGTAKQMGATPASQVSVQDLAQQQRAPANQTAPASGAAATPPELVQQLEAMARNLAAMRNSVEELAAKQEQMAQNIAALQAVEQDFRHEISSPPLSRAVPIPPRKNMPRVASPKRAAQSWYVPRGEPTPRPPLPVR